MRKELYTKDQFSNKSYADMTVQELRGTAGFAPYDESKNEKECVNKIKTDNKLITVAYGDVYAD